MKPCRLLLGASLLLAGPLAAQSNAVSQARTGWLADLRVTLPDQDPGGRADPVAGRVRLPTPLRESEAPEARPSAESQRAEAVRQARAGRDLQAGRLLWQSARNHPDQPAAVNALADHLAAAGDLELATRLRQPAPAPPVLPAPGQ